MTHLHWNTLKLHPTPNEPSPSLSLNSVWCHHLSSTRRYNYRFVLETNPARSLETRCGVERGFRRLADRHGGISILGWYKRHGIHVAVWFRILSFYPSVRTNDEAVEANTNPLHSVCHTHTKNWRETVDTALFSITHSTTDGSFIRWWSLHADWVPIIYYSSEIQCDKWHITHSWAGLPIFSSGHVTLVVVRTVCTLYSCSLHKTKYENQLNRPDAARISFSSTHMKNLANE